MFKYPVMLGFGFRWLLLWAFFDNIIMNECAAKRSVIKITRGEVFDSPPLVRAKGNVVHFRNGSLTGVFIEASFYRDLPQLKINGVLTLRSKDGELQTALYNNTISVCEFLEQPFRHRVLQIVLQEIMQRGNIPTKCPIHAGTYYVRNATFAKARVPSFLPASQFRIDINLLQGNPLKLLLETHWFGRIVKV